MSASNYAEAKILDHTLGVASHAMPTVVYMGLHTADPGETGAGAELTDYTRQTITFGAASGATSSNTNEVVFDDLPSATITHFAIWDADENGNVLYYGPLAASQVLVDGDSYTVQAGQVTVTGD